MEKKTNTILIFILAALSLSLVAAYTIEHGLGHKACKLCLYQRIPYFFSIFLILNILLIKRFVKPTLLLLALVSLSGSVLAFYHFGIEQGFFSESFVCEAQNLDNNLSKEEVLKICPEKRIMVDGRLSKIPYEIKLKVQGTKIKPWSQTLYSHK